MIPFILDELLLRLGERASVSRNPVASVLVGSEHVGIWIDDELKLASHQVQVGAGEIEGDFERAVLVRFASLRDIPGRISLDEAEHLKAPTLRLDSERREPHSGFLQDVGNDLVAVR
jgi:hypothetical protein